MTSTDDNIPTLTKPAATQNGNPFAREGLQEHVNAGAVAIEQERAIAEAQGKLVIAKRFPRNPYEAYERIMAACRRPGMAGSAFYSYNRGNEMVSGPSIRLAEELARCWGNIDYGLRELSNREGVSEMEAYAWDLETNTMSSQKFTVRHIRDTKYGAKNLGSQRDIYEITANMGARRMRARIMAILPDDMVNAAVEQCRQTLAGAGAESLVDRVRKMVAAFGKLGVTVKHLEEYLGHSLDKTLADELVTMIGIYNSLKDNQTTVSDWFGVNDNTDENKVSEKTEEKPQANTEEAKLPPGGNISPTPDKPKKRGRPKKESQQEPQNTGESIPVQAHIQPVNQTVNPQAQTEVVNPTPSNQQHQAAGNDEEDLF